MFYKKRQGQTFIEYSIMLGVLVTALVAMTPMMRRGIQGMVKLMADQVGTQQNAEQVGGRFGHVINSVSFTEVKQDIETIDRLGVAGKIFKTDQTFTDSSIYLNQGFIEKDD